MKILHDWDRTLIEGRWARNRSFSLFLYCLSRKFPFINRIKYFDDNARKVEAAQLAYMETLIQLAKISGVTPIFGIRDVIRERYGKEIDALAIKYDVEIRRHIHIGEIPDPDRKRLWEPPLTQSKDTWGFGVKYARGERVVLKEGELAIWHVDRPQFLPIYISYLYEEICNG